MTGLSPQQYLDVASSRDAETFRRRLGQFAEQLEFPLINASLVVEQPGGPPVIVGVRNTSEPDFEADVDSDAARREPVLHRLKTMSIPFIYDQSLNVAEKAGDLWEEQAPHGYRTGIAMALHMPGGRHFLMGVDRSEPLPSDTARVLRLMADLQLLAVYAQETATRLLLPSAGIDGDIPRLTPREQDILRWARDGKSSSVIADILQISLSTVNYHLGSAMKKLGVVTKHQAALRQIGWGCCDVKRPAPPSAQKHCCTEAAGGAEPSTGLEG